MYKNRIVVVDYGVNNVSSICKALKFCNIEYTITSNPEVVENCNHMILPGVGSFDSGCENLRSNGLNEAIVHSINKGSYFLGICLGMQLLFDTSNESKNNSKGLGLIRGRVTNFNTDDKITIPHIGWNEVFTKGDNKVVNVLDETNQYFVHSFYVDPKEDHIVSAECFHGVKFPAVVVKDNIYGAQFHPEKSSTGIEFMDKFCNQ